MNVSVPKEVTEGERRVALVPEVVERLVQNGLQITVEPGAGEGAHHPDAAYEQAGAASGDGFSGDVVAKVAPPSAEEIAGLGGAAELEPSPPGAAGQPQGKAPSLGMLGALTPGDCRTQVVPGRGEARQPASALGAAEPAGLGVDPGKALFRPAPRCVHRDQLWAR
jgi:hypothetical protein